VDWPGFRLVEGCGVLLRHQHHAVARLSLGWEGLIWGAGVKPRISTINTSFAPQNGIDRTHVATCSACSYMCMWWSPECFSVHLIWGVCV
jgi:hypothetical protein